MNRFETAPTPREYAEQVLADTEATLQAAVAIVSPENPEADPQVVFPKPNVPVRAEGEKPKGLTEEQKERLFAEAENLGFGRPESVLLSEAGLSGAVAIIEGGQPHKMMAEALVVTEDPGANVHSLMLTASAQRKVESESEIASATHLFGGDQTGKTEYDMALQVLHKLPAFREPFEGSEVRGPLNFSYDIHNNFEVSEEVSGQLVRVGSIGPTTLSPHVHLLRVDREDYLDENNQPKYRNQPNTSDLIRLADAALRLGGNRDTPIAFVTSGVYRPSRAVLAAIAGLELGGRRHVGLATYGNDLVNEVRDTNLPPPIKQLPGELQYMAEMAVELRAALEAPEA
jgi:hypothetical protein